jgi:hypothetical protein
MNPELGTNCPVDSSLRESAAERFMPSSSLESPVQIIVRSIGERTTAACELACRRLVPDAPVAIVREQPFERALQEMCRVAPELGRDWTLVVDADLLLTRTAVEVLRHGHATQPGLFQFQAAIVDKFGLRARVAGPRLFSTPLLVEARKQVPQPGVSLRPETTMIEAMAQRGHPSATVAEIIAIHDFEQSYRDIYRKGILHGKKHRSWTKLVDEWLVRGATDPDFAVLAAGFFDGLLSRFDRQSDETRESDACGDVLRRLGLSEKPELSAEAIRFEDVERIVNSGEWPWAYGVAGQKYQSAQPKSLTQRLSASVKELGVLRTGPYLLGRAIRETGRRIEDWVGPPIPKQS